MGTSKTMKSKKILVLKSFRVAIWYGLTTDILKENFHVQLVELFTLGQAYLYLILTKLASSSKIAKISFATYSYSYNEIHDIM